MISSLGPQSPASALGEEDRVLPRERRRPGPGTSLDQPLQRPRMPRWLLWMLRSKRPLLATYGIALHPGPPSPQPGTFSFCPTL